MPKRQSHIFSIILISPVKQTDFTYKKQKQKNSMVLVRERTIPTERPPLVGEVIANFCG
jgi:hypothetical protein